MGFRAFEKFANVQSVVASGIATALLPVAGTYYGLMLHCVDGAGAAVSVANIISDITNVKVTLDGVTVLEASASFLFKLYDQQYAKDGAAQRAGMLPVIFSPDYLERTMDADIVAWGMKDIQAFQVELTLGAGIATANHISAIAVYAERIAETRPLGVHRRLLKFARSFASAGVQEVTDLPFEGGSNVVTTAWHAQYAGAAAVVNDFEVLVNNQLVIKHVPLAAQFRLEKSGRKWMVAGATDDIFSVPFDLTGDTAGYLPHKNVNDLRFRITWSAAPNAYVLYRESYHGLKRPN